MSSPQIGSSSQSGIELSMASSYNTTLVLVFMSGILYESGLIEDCYTEGKSRAANILYIPVHGRFSIFEE